MRPVTCDSLFHDEDHLARRLERVPQQQQLGVVQVVHDRDLLLHLGALRRLDLDELGGKLL